MCGSFKFSSPYQQEPTYDPFREEYLCLAYVNKELLVFT